MRPDSCVLRGSSFATSRNPAADTMPHMKRTLYAITLAGLTACASGIPPAPSAAPVSSAVPDTLVPVFSIDALTQHTSAADAEAVNDLAEATPDASEVPAFDARGVEWDIDVQ